MEIRLVYTEANVYKKLQQKKTLTLLTLFMDGVKLPQRYRATTRIQFNFLPLSSQVSTSFWYSTDRPRKNEGAELTLESPSGFEYGATTTGLGIQCLNH